MQTSSSAARRKWSREPEQELGLPKSKLLSIAYVDAYHLPDRLESGMRAERIETGIDGDPHDPLVAQVERSLEELERSRVTAESESEGRQLVRRDARRTREQLVKHRFSGHGVSESGRGHTHADPGLLYRPR